MKQCVTGALLRQDLENMFCDPALELLDVSDLVLELLYMSQQNKT